MSITITLNGESKVVSGKALLAQVLKEWGYETGFAVAINQQFIPRSQFEVTSLRAGDAIEVVTPMQGG